MARTQRSNQKVVTTFPVNQSIVDVTPALAREWLQHNTFNRALRVYKVNQYARDMTEGRWTISESDLCFAVDGTLMNGQHRLHAVIASGRTVPMGVKRNVPADAMPNMDTGAARTGSDILTFSGERNSSLLASTVKQAVLAHTGRLYGDTKQQAVSHAELVEFLAAHGDIRDSVHLIATVKAHVDAPPTALALAHWLIARRAGTDLATVYFNQLAKPVGEPERSAIHAVNSRLRQIRGNRQRYTTREYTSLLVRGWNYWAADKGVRTLMIVTKGEFRLPDVSAWRRS